jgi:hypothetical protein
MLKSTDFTLRTAHLLDANQVGVSLLSTTRGHDVLRQGMPERSNVAEVNAQERVWNRDLSGYDPDEPLPEDEPIVSEDHMNRARQWRELAEVENLSIGELMIEVSATVAREIDELVDISRQRVVVAGCGSVGAGRRRPR